MPESTLSLDHLGAHRPSPAAALREALTLDDFLADPRPVTWAQGCAIFYGLGRLRGFQLARRARLADVREAMELVSTVLARTPERPDHTLLVDLRAMNDVDLTHDIDLAYFDVFLDFWKARRTAMAQRLAQHAVVRPAGALGAVVSTFYGVLQPKHPLQVFGSVREAAQWLTPFRSPELEALVVAMESPRRADGLAARLQAWLGEHLTDATPEDAARALGVTVRTMQRRLRSGTTSYHELLRRCRIEAAQRLLRDGELKLSAIAHEVGFQSSQQFSTSFRTLTELTPSEYRARCRRTGGQPEVFVARANAGRNGES